MTDAQYYKLNSPRVHTTHGKKKNQGLLAMVNNKAALCFTEGGNDNIIGYTLLEDLLVASCSIELPVVSLEF